MQRRAGPAQQANQTQPADLVPRPSERLQVQLPFADHLHYSADATNSIWQTETTS
ncbi:unnamed protein product [Trichogramma brassicae]|uniref:Uncharacterized protein n=1 Tax=Trichogramma brassicae TaxID=86971 RepID=A0A6H5IB24_9HYME|nr:unnamed protein product [Trichogramma brassicae]